MVINRIGPLSLAKLAGVLYGILGLIGGAVFAAIAAVGGLSAAGESEGAAFAAFFGVGAIVFFPLLYGGMGFLMALIGAALYNVIAGMVGGIEVQMQ
jgi:Transmembrane domain of unknown function (DUF3566)